MENCILGTQENVLFSFFNHRSKYFHFLSHFSIKTKSTFFFNDISNILRVLFFIEFRSKFRSKAWKSRQGTLVSGNVKFSYRSTSYRLFRIDRLSVKLIYTIWDTWEMKNRSFAVFQYSELQYNIFSSKESITIMQITSFYYSCIHSLVEFIFFVELFFFSFQDFIF